MRHIKPGRLLRMAMFEAGELQQQVAVWMEVSPGTLSKYCSGEYAIPSEKIGKLSKTRIGRTETFKELQEAMLYNFIEAINYKSNPDRKPPGGAGAMELPRVA